MSYLIILVLWLRLCSIVSGVDTVFEHTTPLDGSNWGKSCLAGDQLFVIILGSTDGVFTYLWEEGENTISFYTDVTFPNTLRDMYCFDDTIIVLDDQNIYMLDTDLELLNSYEIITDNAKITAINNTILIRDKYQLITLSFNITSANITLLEHLTPLDIPWLGTTDFPSICCGYLFCWLNDKQTLYRYFIETNSMVETKLDEGSPSALFCQDDFLWIAYNYTEEDDTSTWVVYTTTNIDETKYNDLRDLYQPNINAIPTRYITLTGYYYSPYIFYQLGVMFWPNTTGVVVIQMFPYSVYNDRIQVWPADNSPRQIFYMGHDNIEDNPRILITTRQRDSFIITISSEKINGYLVDEFTLEYVMRIIPFIFVQNRMLGIVIITVMAFSCVYLFVFKFLAIVCAPIHTHVVTIDQILAKEPPV